MYWLIGCACLAIWFIGYGMGKGAAWRELGRAGGYDLQQKVLAYRNRNKNRNKKLVQAVAAQTKKR